MKDVIISAHEINRLKVLREAKILDTPIHSNFERLVDLALKIFDVPIVAISLIDENRQWFKAIRGCDLKETPRNISICNHTITQDDVMVIHDAQNDPTFKDNPMVTGELGVRFYAGCPIHAGNNQPIGAFCLADNKPRLFTEREKLILKDLATLAEVEIKNLTQKEDYLTINTFLQKKKSGYYLDEITKVWNAAGMRLLLKHTLENHKKVEPFGLINLSIDGFNSFAEEQGHEAGHELLAAVARELVSTCDKDEIIGYLGGKEFLIIVPCSQKEKTVAIANLLLEKQKKEIIKLHTGLVKTTLSIGSVYYDKSKHKDLESLLEDAHQALEEGKQAGGNQVIYH